MGLLPPQSHRKNPALVRATKDTLGTAPDFVPGLRALYATLMTLPSGARDVG
jgi:hypothetical protein